MFRHWRHWVRGIQKIPQRQFRLQSVHHKYDPSKTLYQVLGVSPNATSDEIKEAYSIKYMQYKKTFDEGRPDHEMIAPYNQAYGVLVNSQNRAEYDYYLKKEKLGNVFDEKKDKPPGPGIESQFYGFSQTHYRYPLFYKDPLLKEEATKVWVRHLQMQNLDEMNKTPPKVLRRTIVLGLLAIFGLSGLIHIFVVSKLTQKPKHEEFDFKKIMRPDEAHIGSGLPAHYMPKDVYYDSRTGTYRKKDPVDPYKHPVKEIEDENVLDLSGK